MQCPHNMYSWAQTVYNSGLHVCRQHIWCHGNHSTWTLGPVCVGVLLVFLFGKVCLLSVANIFLVLSSISCCHCPCCVLSIPSWIQIIVHSSPPSCMAVCSPYLHNAVPFYICPCILCQKFLSKCSFLSTLDMLRHIPSTGHSLCVHILPKVVCPPVVLSPSFCLSGQLFILEQRLFLSCAMPAVWPVVTYQHVV